MTGGRFVKVENLWQLRDTSLEQTFALRHAGAGFNLFFVTGQSSYP